ncbi:MAG TPA: hypothetical protein PK777_15035, partial [Thermoguttaceae bacterium]|nr:hypothetical protein [Thermoguttaceae bacterium]
PCARFRPGCVVVAAMSSAIRWARPRMTTNCLARTSFTVARLAPPPDCDPGASGWITVQGCGRIGPLAIQTPVMIRFGEEPWDEVFITAEAAQRGVVVENTGSEPLVSLRYFGPNVHKKTPQIGDHRKYKKR